MIDEVMRLATLASSLMASSTLVLALVIGVGGTVERFGAGCYGCLEAKSIRALARPPEPLRITTAAVRPLQRH